MDARRHFCVLCVWTLNGGWTGQLPGTCADHDAVSPILFELLLFLQPEQLQSDFGHSLWRLTSYFLVLTALS